jgi:hypothetical protein
LTRVTLLHSTEAEVCALELGTTALDDQRASAPAPLSLLLLGERSHPGADASRQLGASR